MKQIVAVDIGTYLTKVIVAELKGKVVEVSALNFFPTPYQKEDIFDEETFFEKLFSTVPQNQIKASQLAIGLPSPTTNFSFFEIPAMARADLQKAIVSEAQRTIRPTPADNDILRYVILKNTQPKELRHTSVLAGAGIEADILRYFSLFEHQGITPSFIGSSASSLMVYPLGYYPDLPDNWCFIDIGYTNTTIVIFSRNIPTLVRTIIFASRDFVRAISTARKIEMEEAQNVFLKQEAPDSVSNSWKYLISEIRRSFAYYKEISTGKAIEGVYFSGGIFSIGPYIDSLKKNIGGKIELFDLSSVNKLSLERLNPEEISTGSYFFANSLGLVLSSVEKKQVLNFLPASVLKEKQNRQVQSLAKQAIVFATGALVIIFFLLLFRAFSAQVKFRTEAKGFSEPEYKKVISVEKEIIALASIVKTQEDFVSAQAKINQSQRKVFSVIAKYIPTNAYLATSESSTEGSSASSGPAGRRRGRSAQGSSGSEKNFKCDGWIYASYEDSVDQLRLFLKKLLKSGIFEEISLVKRPGLEDEPFLPYASDFTMEARRKFQLELKLK